MRVKLVGEFTLNEFALGLLEVLDKLRDNNIDNVRDAELTLTTLDGTTIIDFVTETSGDLETWAFHGPAQLRETRTAK